jgi:leucyl aminopeptidase
MPEADREFMTSELADVQNLSSTKFRGAITAALFLSEFVTQTRWAHLDIAGTAYLKAGGDYCPPGGTGLRGPAADEAAKADGALKHPAPSRCRDMR